MGPFGNEGSLNTLAVLIRDTSKKTVTHSGIDYPASINFTPIPGLGCPPYTESVREGVFTVQKLLTERAKSCPSQRIVLLGNSEGAHVVGDALGGCGGKYITPLGYTLGFGPDIPPVLREIGDKGATSTPLQL